MLRRALTTLLATALFLAPPATALADGGGGGAGDQQYQDPLNLPSTHKKKPKPANAVTAPASSSPSSSTTAQSQAAPAQATSPAASQLPRTGSPAGLVALIGAVLLACGVALRRYATSV